jgi:sugar O-acyltransferase (sialic acid O-acetyltransferase NeuD family)
MTARPPLLLLGAGGAAREIAEAARATDSFDVLGYLDDDPGRHGSRLAGLPVIGPLAAIDDHPNALVVAAMGNPGAVRSRETVVARLGLDEARFATVISPSASASASCRIGPGSVLLPGAVLTADVSVGAHVLVMPNSVLTHDVVVEDCASLAAGVLLAGGVRIGRSAYVGAGVRVREGVTIGAGALVGMASLVLADVGADEVWYGSPASRRDA